MIKYKIPFVSVSEEHYMIEIDDKNYTGTEVTVLDGGMPPIEIEYGGSDYLYEPLRLAGATISVVENQYFIDLFATDPHQFKVDLWKENEEGTRELKYTGYISPEVYEQDFNGYISGYQIEVISALSTLQYYYFDSNATDIPTLFSLIKEAFSIIPKSYNRVYIPKVFGTGDPDIKLKEYNVLARNFENEEDEPMSYKEILEEICRIFGWTLTEKDGNAYFLDVDYISKGYSAYFVYDGTLNNWGSQSFETSSRLLSEEESTGVDNTISKLGGYNKIVVNASDYEFDSSILFPKMDKLTRLYTVGPTAQRILKTGNGHSKEDDRRYYTQEFFHTSVLKLHLYSRVNNTISDMTDQINGLPTQAMIDEYAGASITRQICSEGGGRTEAKESFANGPMFRFKNIFGTFSSTNFGWGNNLLNSTPTKYPAITYNLSSIAILDTAIQIKGTVRFGENDVGLASDKKRIWQDKPKKMGFNVRDVYLPMKLKIGDKYWNGSTWTTTDSSFHVYLDLNEDSNMNLEWFNIKSTRNNSSSNFDEGYIIPVRGLMAGAVTVIIYTPYYNRTEKFLDHGGQRWALLKDFAINLDAEEEESYVDAKQDTIYTGSINKEYINAADDIEVKITSKNSSLNSYSKIIHKDAILDTIYNVTTGETAKPEHHLITKNLVQYEQPKIKLKQETTPDYKVYQPIEDSVFPGRKFIITSEVINYIDNKSSITMIELF
ncbi:MAG: hypothetical protein LUD74_02475 [Tannerellaceae bacterium]|nr:hypothetical protein [Tannerellaceae bacterium]